MNHDPEMGTIYKTANAGLELFKGLSLSEAMTSLGLICALVIDQYAADGGFDTDDIIERHIDNIRHVIEASRLTS